MDGRKGTHYTSHCMWPVTWSRPMHMVRSSWLSSDWTPLPPTSAGDGGRAQVAPRKKLWVRLMVVQVREKLPEVVGVGAAVVKVLVVARRRVKRVARRVREAIFSFSFFFFFSWPFGG